MGPPVWDRRLRLSVRGGPAVGDGATPLAHFLSSRTAGVIREPPLYARDLNRLASLDALVRRASDLGYRHPVLS